MVYGSLFSNGTDDQIASLRQMGQRWKQYEREGKWVYEQHPFWCTGYTFWSINNEAPDLFQHLSESDLVIFKGDLNHRKLVSMNTAESVLYSPLSFQTYDCQTPSDLSFNMAIGPLANDEGAPPVASLRTIKSDVVVGVDQATADRLDKEEPGWRISGKYAVVLLSDGHKSDSNQ